MSVVMSDFEQTVRSAIRAARTRCVALIVAALLGTTSVAAAPSDSRTASENQVKAGFLFNFARFVEWPVKTSGPLIIGVVGDERFVKALEQVLRDRTVEGRPVMARHLRDGNDPSPCDLLFIPSSWRGRAADVLQGTRGPILTVGESVQFLRDGGIVRLYVEDSRIKFQISRENATTAGLKISSHLLNLASR